VVGGALRGASEEATSVERLMMVVCGVVNRLAVKLLERRP